MSVKSTERDIGKWITVFFVRSEDMVWLTDGTTARMAGPDKEEPVSVDLNTRTRLMSHLAHSLSPGPPVRLPLPLHPVKVKVAVSPPGQEQDLGYNSGRDSTPSPSPSQETVWRPFWPAELLHLTVFLPCTFYFYPDQDANISLNLTNVQVYKHLVIILKNICDTSLVCKIYVIKLLNHKLH